MRTKTLLLTAALSAAGIATSMAQVYSVNAVGYVNTPIVKGFNLISNPLNNTTGNTIANLFGSVPNLPEGFTVYKFENGAYKTPAAFNFGEFSPPDSANLTVNPGEGVFVFNPSDTTLTVTFVGEVPQGNLTVNTPKGFSIVSSPVPQAGTVSSLGFVPAEGDTIYQFANGAYKTPESFNFGEWSPSEPTLGVGEAVFLIKAEAGTWTRTFDVNK
jgi:hypothetical protein